MYSLIAAHYVLLRNRLVIVWFIKSNARKYMNHRAIHAEEKENDHEETNIYHS